MLVHDPSHNPHPLLLQAVQWAVLLVLDNHNMDVEHPRGRVPNALGGTASSLDLLSVPC